MLIEPPDNLLKLLPEIKLLNVEFLAYKLGSKTPFLPLISTRRGGQIGWCIPYEKNGVRNQINFTGKEENFKWTDA